MDHLPARAGRIRLTIGLGAAWTVALALLFLWNLASMERGTREILWAEARAHFDQILTTRRWNAQAGGVFVPTTDDSPQNPFLEDSLRGTFTADGMPLTRVNPAYMVRQVSELAAGADGVQFRMMSDRPLNPKNTPDPWEAEGLAAFLTGEGTERGELLQDGEAPTYRYMAPLLVEPTCLGCHEKQGYVLGEIRGALSVSIPAGPVLRAEALHLRVLLAGYGALWLLGLLGIILSSRHLGRVEGARDRLISQLQTAVDEVQTLHGLLPICARCKKVRNDEGYWEGIESYIGHHSKATFTHGFCPDCSEELYGEDAMAEFDETFGEGPTEEPEGTLLQGGPRPSGAPRPRR